MCFFVLCKRHGFNRVPGSHHGPRGFPVTVYTPHLSSSDAAVTRKPRAVTTLKNLNLARLSLSLTVTLRLGLGTKHRTRKTVTVTLRVTVTGTQAPAAAAARLRLRPPSGPGPPVCRVFIFKDTGVQPHLSVGLISVPQKGGLPGPPPRNPPSRIPRRPGALRP